MFNKSRIRIVVVIMSILIVLLLGMLCFIYASSYFDLYQRNQSVLEHHIKINFIEKDTNSFGNDDIERDLPDLNDNLPFKLTNLYSAVVDKENNIIEVNNIGNVYSNEDLTEIGEELATLKNRGIHKNFIYRCTYLEDNKIIAFMDNTIIQESSYTLLYYTLVFLPCAVVCIFFLASSLAKKIVQPLEESHNKQKQFIADAGHELKTPISIIGVNADMLERQIGENQWLQNIIYENSRMGTLVTQLLELTRVEQVAPVLEKVDLTNLVLGEVLAFDLLAFENGLSLKSDLEEGVFVLGNAAQLRQLTAILLDNGIRHNDKNKDVVEIRLKKEKSNAVISVINSAEEIPLGQRKQIFERLYCRDESHNSSNNHYGLGLAIAKVILKTNKGKISVDCYNGLVEFKICLQIP